MTGLQSVRDSHFNGIVDRVRQSKLTPVAPEHYGLSSDEYQFIIVDNSDRETVTYRGVLHTGVCVDLSPNTGANALLTRTDSSSLGCEVKEDEFKEMNAVEGDTLALMMSEKRADKAASLVVFCSTIITVLGTAAVFSAWQENDSAFNFEFGVVTLIVTLLIYSALYFSNRVIRGLAR